MGAIEGRRGRAAPGRGRRRPAALPALAVALAALLAACTSVAPDLPTGSPSASGADASGAIPTDLATPVPVPSPTPVPPIGGTELVGYLPYWNMTDAMTAYLAKVPLTTLELFSVAVTTDGDLKTSETGYRRIVGDRGKALIAAARGAGMRVELVFTTFGFGPNQKFLLRPETRARAVANLVGLVRRLGVDGLNVDAELVRGDDIDGYTELVGDLATALHAMTPRRTLSVAATGGHIGASLAHAATIAGADRMFLMGYDYHWSGSDPGASAPLGRYDGGHDLRWSIGEYVRLGVPRDRIVLGLPLYGISWPVVAPGYAMPSTGAGTSWVPSQHASLLADSAPSMDPVEIAEYLSQPDGSGGWRGIYYDSPRTLRPKLALARVQGLAGAGFWAIGYERGVPGYLELMRAFRGGSVGPADVIDPAPVAEPTVGPLPWPTATLPSLPDGGSGEPLPSLP